jgi:hypothetical protein
MEIHSTEVKQVYDVFALSIQPALADFYTTSGKVHFDLVKAIEGRYKKLSQSLELANDLSEKVELQREYKKDLLELLTEHGKAQGKTFFDKFYADFEDIVNKKLSEQKRIIHIKEPFEGYSISLKGNPYKNFRKILVNLKRSVALSLKRFTNFFRRIFRKNPIEVTVYRKRRVLFRSMAKEFILNQFLNSTIHLVAKLMERQSKSLIELWKLDEDLDVGFQKILNPDDAKEDSEQEERENPLDIFKRVKADYQAVVKEIEKEIETIGVEMFNLFDNAFHKVDTLDLSHKTFNVNSLEANWEKVIDAYSNEIKCWDNTHAALIDDWSVDVEITLLYYSVFDEFNFLNENIEAFISKNIFDSLKKIKSFIAKSQKEIETAGDTKKGIRDKITAERNRITSQLIDKMLTQLIEKLTSCFTKDFDALLKDTLGLVEQISSNRGFIGNKNYLKGVDKSDVKYISPRELLNFEALPVFKERIVEMEVWVEAHLEKVRINLLGLGTVCDFTLESALMMLEQKESTPKQAVGAVVDGFDRALNHLEKAEAILLAIQATIRVELSKAINNFDYDILKLKDTENLFALNLKIARIKAVERTELYKEKLISIVKTGIPKAKEQLGSLLTKISTKVKTIKLRIGITEQKKYVSFELSEFINQSQQSLKKLPFVYQRLYQLSPTEEERFFVNREKELEMLKKSYTNWQKDRFITVAIIGDKGSGITSLINFFLKKSDINIVVIKHMLSNKIFTIDSYFSLFAELFGVEKFESNDQIINFINQSDGNRIVVLENLQHLFLKQVNGFDCMNQFFELMAHTMKKVLWIGAYTRHSWNYLDRTIHISNYFTNEIYVEPMEMETIQEIIYKRNRLSGFQIIFQPDTFDLKNKKYQKLNETEKQKFLRRKFFSTFHQISSGNISLAQLYWLQSTQLANDDEIHISPIRELDFSFVKNLTSDELFTMQAMIIHDGLDLNDFALVMGKPVSASRNLLTPMLEKGLLIKPNNKYNINPIIFKSVAGYLVSRNFVN